MPRPKPDARTMLLGSAVSIIRTKGYDATAVDELCAAESGMQPGWFGYVSVVDVDQCEDIDVASGCVSAQGGETRVAPHRVPTGDWVMPARDPQGARFALVGPRR